MRRTRLVAAGGGALLFVAGVGAGVMVLRSRDPGHAAYRLQLSAVPAAETADWRGAHEVCPESGRGEGPIGADQEPTAGVRVGSGQAVGAGQLLAYHVRVDADATAPPQGDVAATVTFSGRAGSSIDLGKGVVCAFVDESDPQTTAVGASVSREDTLPSEVGQPLRSALRINGMQAGTSAVVELWVAAASEQPRNNAVIDASLGAVEAPAGARARVMVPDARIASSSRTSRDIRVELEGPSGPLAPLQDVELTARIRNGSAEELARDIRGKIELDASLALTNVEVIDDTGVETTCTLASGAVSCAAPYLVPSERVTVVLHATIAADAPKVFQRSGPGCAPKAQDLCVSVSAASSGGVPLEGGQAALAIDLPAPDTLSATKITASGERGLYVGRITDFLYVVTLGTETPVTRVGINDPACAPAILVGGDDGDDGILSPGETWTFRCSGMVDRSQMSDVTITATSTSGAAVRAITRLATPILDPGMTVTAKEVDDQPGLEVVNSGDAELDDVIVRGRDCEPIPNNGDNDDDGLLDPGERWRYKCRSAAEAARAYGTDPAGGAVTAALEQ